MRYFLKFIFQSDFFLSSFFIYIYIMGKVWVSRPEGVYGCVSCSLQVQGPWRELQFCPNEWGHYVSAYNINKLCKWICCYTTMPLLSKHKQYCTNGQMFRMLKYDETCSRGGIRHFYIHTYGENRTGLQKSPLCKCMNHKWLPRALYFNEIIFWPALTYFYGPC